MGEKGFARATSETMMSQISLLTFRYSNFRVINIKRITDGERASCVRAAHDTEARKRVKGLSSFADVRDESDSASFPIQIRKVVSRFRADFKLKFGLCKWKVFIRGNLETFLRSVS